MTITWRTGVRRKTETHTRQWPSAFVVEGQNEAGKLVATIGCETPYTWRRSRGIDDHAPLSVSFTMRNKPHSDKGNWDWGKMEGQYTNLQAAKRAFEKFYAANPSLFKETKE